MTEVRSKADALTRPFGRGYSAPTILACTWLLTLTACSALQPTSSNGTTPSSPTLTSGVASEATESSGGGVVTAVENGGDPLGAAWAPESAAATPPPVTPARRAKAPTFDWQSLDRIQLADSSGSPMIMTAQNTGAEEGMSLEKAAQKSNNPVSDAWLLITQNDLTRLDTPNGSEWRNRTSLQPVMPIPILDGEWNIVNRIVTGVVTAPIDDDLNSTNPFDGRTTGNTDTVYFALAAPNRDDGWIWGLGPTFILPTATEDVLGQEKWQAGPAALLVRLGNDYGGFGWEHFNIGVLAQHWWDFAGER